MTFSPNTLIKSADMNTVLQTDIATTFNSALNGSTGHTHDGTSQNGAPVVLQNASPTVTRQLGSSGGILQVHDGTAARTMQTLETPQSVSGAKTYANNTLKLGGAGAGVATLTNANTANNRTWTLPDNGGNATVSCIDQAQNRSAIETAISGGRWNGAAIADAFVLTTATPTISSSIGHVNNQINVFDGTSARIYAPIDKSSFGIHNLGLKLSVGALSVTGLGNTALGATNSGWVSYPGSTAGVWLSQPVTADQTISSGGIKGRLGTTASVAWGSDMPMFVYVTSKDDTAAGIRFFISRQPNMTTTPASTNNIGIDGTAPATDGQGNIVLFGSTANTGYNSRPCRIIGSFRGQIDASAGGVMTVSALDSGDGIGVFKNAGGRTFTMPISQNGATSGKYLSDNGGTAPTYTAQNDFTYRIDLGGNCTVRTYFLNSAGGTAGAGAVTARVALPYVTTSATNAVEYGSGFFDNTGVTGLQLNWSVVPNSSFATGTTSTSGTTGFQNANQSQTARQFGFSLTYAAY